MWRCCLRSVSRTFPWLAGFALGMGLLFFPAPIRAGSSDGLLARFKSDAGDAWKTLEAFDQSPATIRITSKVEEIRNGQIKHSIERVIVVKRKRGHFMVEETTEEGQLAYGQNPAYRFLIGRKKGNDGWLLMELIEKGPRGFPEIEPQVGEYLYPNTWGYVDMPLTKLLEAKEFRPIKAEKIGPEVVRVHFKMMVRVGKHDIRVTGWMDLNPEKAWSLRECQYSDGDSITKVSRGLAHASLNGVFPCDRSEVASVYPSTKQEMRSANQYEIVNMDVPAVELFYLSSFGLPEPRGIEAPSSRSWFLPITLGAIAALAAGVLLRRISGSAQSRASTQREEQAQ